MSKDEYIDWEVDQCDNCVRTAHHAMHNEKKGISEKWFCVGNIPQPNDPNDTHDLVNKIRICIKKNDKETDQYEWTPYEASIISAFLTMAISNELYEDQPYLEKDNKLIIAD